MPVTVKTVNKFPSIAARLATGARQLEQTSAQRLAADARGVAPYRTGALKLSITAQGNTVRVLTYYARFVERGTQNMLAEPFLGPATFREARRLQADLPKLLKRP